MASSKVKYGQNSVYGSLAYDFDNPALYPDVEYGRPLERTAPPRTEEAAQQRTGGKAHARAKQSVSLFSIAGVLTAAVIFVVAMMAQVQLLDVTNTSVELQQQLDELQTEQTKLKIKYESVFNLTEIEEYATAKLGMQKPSADQVYYIDTSSPDKAVVVGAQEESGFVDRVSDFIFGLGEYFR